MVFELDKYVFFVCVLYSSPLSAVYMKDVKSEDMEALLDFMYRGVVHIPQESLTGLLKTAEGLQVWL